jgi:tRNA (adenine37-N6)-methyltransferase
MIEAADDPDDPPRDGEIVSPGPLSADAALTFIGRIETPWTTRGDCPRRGDPQDGPLCRLVLDPRWAPALDGLEPGADLQVLYWMHQARRDLVRLVPGHATPRGPFALRAPTRPNPIASSRVTLVAREGATLVVRGLDCLDGTPLLDIKPWRAD